MKMIRNINIFPFFAKIAHTMQLALQKIISAQKKKNFEQWRF